MPDSRSGRRGSILRKPVPAPFTEENVRRHLATSERLEEDSYGSDPKIKPPTISCCDTSSQKGLLGTASRIGSDESTQLTYSTRPSSFSASAVGRSEQPLAKPSRAQIGNLEEVMATMRLQPSNSFLEADKIELARFSEVVPQAKSLSPVLSTNHNDPAMKAFNIPRSSESQQFIGFSLQNRAQKPLDTSAEMFDPLKNHGFDFNPHPSSTQEETFKPELDLIGCGHDRDRFAGKSAICELKPCTDADTRQFRRKHVSTDAEECAFKPSPFAYPELQSNSVSRTHLTERNGRSNSIPLTEVIETARRQPRVAGGVARESDWGAGDEVEDSKRMGGSSGSSLNGTKTPGNFQPFPSPLMPKIVPEEKWRDSTNDTGPMSAIPKISAVQIQSQPIVMSQGGKVVGVIPAHLNLAAIVTPPGDAEGILETTQRPKEPTQSGQQRRARPPQNSGVRKSDRVAKPRAPPATLPMTLTSATETPGMPITKRKGVQGGKRQLFACPFAKHNPQRYYRVYNQCTNRPGLESRLLKEHIKRVHSVVYKRGCTWCSWKWADSSTWYENFVAHECLVRGNSEELLYHPESMTQDQEEALDRADLTHLNTGQDRWVWIYLSLFPGSFPVPSPFFNFTIINPNLGQDHRYPLFEIPEPGTSLYTLASSGHGPIASQNFLGGHQETLGGNATIPHAPEFASTVPNSAPAESANALNWFGQALEPETALNPDPSLSNTYGNYHLANSPNRQVPSIGTPNNFRGYGEAYHFDGSSNCRETSNTAQAAGVARTRAGQHVMDHREGLYNHSFATTSASTSAATAPAATNSSEENNFPRHVFATPEWNLLDTTFNNLYPQGSMAHPVAYQQPFRGQIATSAAAAAMAATTTTTTRGARSEHSSRESSRNDYNPTPEDSD